MKTRTERIKMIEKEHVLLSVVQQCLLVSIHRGGLYYKPISESEENLEIMQKLDKQYFNTPFYGVKKLTAWLQRQDYKINVKRMRRLMKLVYWKTIYREPKTTVSDKTHYKYPYLLKDLKIKSINQVWATDITYIPMKQGFMYLCAIIDLYSRKVLNWSVSNTMSAEWCNEILLEAIKNHGKPEIFNTDQGSQFTSELFINTLKNNEIQISMDGKGRAIDNIFVERLWRSVKYEHIYLHAYENGVDLYRGLDNYFTFYNNERPHQSLNYRTPNEIYHTKKAA